MKVSIGLVFPEASLLGLHMAAFMLCPYMMMFSLYDTCLVSFCVSEFPLLIKTPVRLGLGPPMTPHWTLITSLKDLFLNAVSLGVRLQQMNFGGTQFSPSQTSLNPDSNITPSGKPSQIFSGKLNCRDSHITLLSCATLCYNDLFSRLYLSPPLTLRLGTFQLGGFLHYPYHPAVGRCSRQSSIIRWLISEVKIECVGFLKRNQLGIFKPSEQNAERLSS